jgi:hypothetical protein
LRGRASEIRAYYLAGSRLAQTLLLGRGSAIRAYYRKAFFNPKHNTFLRGAFLALASVSFVAERTQMRLLTPNNFNPTPNTFLAPFAVVGKKRYICSQINPKRQQT